MQNDRISLFWLRTSAFTPNEFRQLGERILETKFKRNGTMGFLVDAVTPDRIQGKLVERNQRTSEIVDPFGTRKSIEWFEFRIFSFQFNRLARLVEVESASRGVSRLAQQLGAASSWRSFFEPATLEPQALIDYLKENAEPYDIVSARLEPFSLSANTICELKAEGTRSVLNDLRKIGESRSIVISKAKFILNKFAESVAVEVSRSGKLSIQDNEAGDARRIVRSAISAQIEAANRI